MKPAFRRIAAVLAFGLLSAHPALALETGTVDEIVDGDTLRVRSAGTILTVRLIGIDAPERSHPSRSAEFLAGESAAFLASLCAGKTVRMEPGAEESDRYGRLLRYVFLVPPDGRLLNEEMVRHGYARVYRRFPFSREAAFRAAEEEARRKERGIWREGGMAEVRQALQGSAAATVHRLPGELYGVVCGGMVKAGIRQEDLGKTLANVVRWREEYADADFARRAGEAGFVPLRDAAAPAGAGPQASPTSPPTAPSPLRVGWQEAHLHVGRDVIVEGTLVRVRRAKRVLFLNFHSNWRKYVTVVIPGRDLGLFPRDPETFYGGKTVRVRGTVALYDGRPEIVVRTPEDITIVEDRPPLR